MATHYMFVDSSKCKVTPDPTSKSSPPLPMIVFLKSNGTGDMDNATCSAFGSDKYFLTPPTSANLKVTQNELNCLAKDISDHTIQLEVVIDVDTSHTNADNSQHVNSHQFPAIPLHRLVAATVASLVETTARIESKLDELSRHLEKRPPGEHHEHGDHSRHGDHDKDGHQSDHSDEESGGVASQVG
jgi:hypothetical protein